MYIQNVLEGFKAAAMFVLLFLSLSLSPSRAISFSQFSIVLCLLKIYETASLVFILVFTMVTISLPFLSFLSVSPSGDQIETTPRCVCFVCFLLFNFTVLGVPLYFFLFQLFFFYVTVATLALC